MINDHAGDYCERCVIESKFNVIDKAINVLGNNNSNAKTNSCYTVFERIINVLANVILILGIITSIIMSFTIIIENDSSFGRWTYTEGGFSPIGFAIVIFTLISSVLLWALLKVTIEVSVNIREIAKSK